MRKLIVWHNLNKDTYYYKFITGCYTNYNIGYKNQYNHEIILIVSNPELQPIKEYVSLRRVLLTPIVNFLKFLLKFLDK